MTTTIDYVRTMAPTHIAREIAEAAGVTTARVYAIAKTHGIKLIKAVNGPRYKGLTKTVREAVRAEALRRAGPSADDAARLDALRGVLLDLGVWADSAEGPEMWR